MKRRQKPSREQAREQAAYQRGYAAGMRDANLRAAAVDAAIRNVSGIPAKVIVEQARAFDQFVRGRGK